MKLEKVTFAYRHDEQGLVTFLCHDRLKNISCKSYPQMCKPCDFVNKVLLLLLLLLLIMKAQKGKVRSRVTSFTVTITLFVFKVAHLTRLSPTLNSTNFSGEDIAWKNQLSAQMKCKFSLQMILRNCIFFQNVQILAN